MKILRINKCAQCPHCRQDANITRWECSASHRKMICWDDEDAIDDGVPAWCPLEEEPAGKEGA